MSGMESIRRESSRLSRASANSYGTQGKSSATGSGTGRPSLLAKAYNSMSYRGARHAGGRTSAFSSSKLSRSSEGAESIETSTTAAQPSQQVQTFKGVFAVPEPECKPSQPAELSDDQSQKYEELLQHVQSTHNELPCSLKAEDKKRQPASEWEKLRYLSRESLLRYLRATKWDVKAAQKRLTETIAWHREFGTESLDPDEMAKEAKSGKETVLGYDNSARPLHYMHPHRNDTKESPRQMQFAVWILERCIDLMPPGVEQLALLINFEHKSRNPTSIANAKLMLYILQNHYVERLGIALCINVPWVFKMFWNAIQAFIDPVTKSKCRFDEAVKSEVPLSQLKTDFGGNLSDKYVHDDYWPELVRVSKERRDEMLRRFKEDCKGELGASEWVIRGGDDPNSPFNNAKRAGTSDSQATSTDTSSMAAGPVQLTDSAPLEKFVTPMSYIQPNPLDRTFSSATHAAPAVVAANASDALSVTSEKPEKETEEQGKQEQKHDLQHSPHHHHLSVFKDMDRKIHASKLFAAFHPDSQNNAPHGQKKNKSSRRQSKDQSSISDDKGSTKTSNTGVEIPKATSQDASQRSDNVPSANEIAAIAGTSGPSSAAGAVGAVVVGQTKNGIGRVSSTAGTGVSATAGTIAFASSSSDRKGAKDVNTSDEAATGEEEQVKEQVLLVDVLFFAAAKDAVGGRGKHHITLPASEQGVPLDEFITYMLKTFENTKPGEQYNGEALRKVIDESMWAVDEAMVEKDELHTIKLHGGESVAVIPPVSGG